MANYNDRTPPYVRYLAPLIRPFPNFDFFFMKSMRKRAINALQLRQGSRALDVGCGPGALSHIWWNRLDRTATWSV
jgi:ubiquinone/menaquinone biosynthesis C-methylase UbiE